jgi:hypothetical protein
MRVRRIDSLDENLRKRRRGAREQFIQSVADDIPSRENSFIGRVRIGFALG